LHNICIDHAEEFDESLAPDESDEGEVETVEDYEAAPVDCVANALSIAEASKAMRQYLWARCPPDIKAKGVREWHQSILKG